MVCWIAKLGYEDFNKDLLKVDSVDIVLSDLFVEMSDASIWFV